nr:DUF2827 family protein [Cupriavidus sp. BIC8F]
MLSRPVRVGISYFGRREPQSIWANGAVQNCFFLYWLFQRCPGVGEVWMVSTPAMARPARAAWAWHPRASA